MPSGPRPPATAIETSPGAAAANAILHASCIAVEGRAALFLGRSGSGKSRLALECLARGAALVADDRVVVRRAGDRLLADAPPSLRGLIEARGVGLLRARPAGPALLALAVDLDQGEGARLPPPRRHDLLGVSLPLLHNPEKDHFPAAIVQYLRGGRYV